MLENEDRILVVDDEPGVRDALEAVLRDEGFPVDTCGSGEDALEQVKLKQFSAIFLDVWLPEMDGLETLTELRLRDIDAEVVMISGHGTIDTAVRATKLGAFDFIEKPLSLEKTLLVLRNALRQRRLRRVNVKLLAQLSRDTAIIGKSAAASALRRDIAAAGSRELPVWIVGEPGSGRETVARRIHGLASDAEAPFVDVRCAALDAVAARDALFGSADGGRLRLVAGGTLLLTDVDRLPTEDQRRLAEVLNAEQSNRRFQIVTISRHDADAIDAALREVLTVIRIDVPPLRQRREDIPEFAVRFLSELTSEYGGPQKSWTPAALTALQQHDWPGNVAELRNLVEHVVMSVRGASIEPTDLPIELGGRGRPVIDFYADFDSLREATAVFRRFYVGRVLEQESGDRVRTTERLGVTPAELEEFLGGG